MKNKKTTTEEFWQEDPTYQTGSTKPPKNYGGIIAFLLVLVIFLCGISTGLGLMNIHLFRQLTTIQEPCAVAFSEAPESQVYNTDDSLVDFALGFTGQGVPEFWQHYHDLPQGVYVTEVTDGSCAHKWGILPGDVLTHLDSIPVPNAETLESLLQTLAPGSVVNVDIYREGAALTLTITVE